MRSLLFWRRKRKEHPVTQYAGRLVQERKGKRILHYRPSLVEVGSISNATALGVYRFLIKNKEALESGERIPDPKTGAVIQKGFTGDYAGNHNLGTYRIELAGQTFFLKFSKYRFDQVSAYTKAREVLESRGHRIKGFGFVLLMPHIVYAPRNKKGEIIVTDFIKSKEITSLYNYSTGRYVMLPPAAEKAFQAARLLLHENGIRDIEKHNAFYHAKTKSFFLFDLRDRIMPIDA